MFGSPQPTFNPPTALKHSPLMARDSVTCFLVTYRFKRQASDKTSDRLFPVCVQILESEGERQAKINNSEAVKLDSINRAQGRAPSPYSISLPHSLAA